MEGQRNTCVSLRIHQLRKEELQEGKEKYMRINAFDLIDFSTMRNLYDVSWSIADIAFYEDEIHESRRL
jgi:hypothetical protein